MANTINTISRSEEGLAMTDATVAARVSDGAEASDSAVSWAAIIAGAVVASAFSLALLTLGGGVGLVSIPRGRAPLVAASASWRRRGLSPRSSSPLASAATSSAACAPLGQRPRR